MGGLESLIIYHKLRLLDPSLTRLGFRPRHAAWPRGVLDYVENGTDSVSQDGGMHVCRKDAVNPGRFASWDDQVKKDDTASGGGH